MADGKRTLADLFALPLGKEAEDDLFSPPEPAAIVPAAPPPTPAERNDKQLKRVTDNLLDKSSWLLDSSLATFELTDKELAAQGPPERWVEEFGPDKAFERWNAARFARMAKREAPVAIDLAEKVHSSITRADAMKKKAQVPQLAVALIEWPTSKKEEDVEVIDVVEVKEAEDFGDDG